MKIKMLTGIASHEWSYAPGEEIDLDEKTALAWVENGFAELIEKEQPKKVQEEEKPKRGGRK